MLGLRMWRAGSGTRGPLRCASLLLVSATAVLGAARFALTRDEAVRQAGTSAINAKLGDTITVICNADANAMRAAFTGQVGQAVSDGRFYSGAKPETSSRNRPPRLRSKPLEVSTPVPQGLNSFHFVGRVGGVAFDQVAVPESQLRVTGLRLCYSANREDGNRLNVILNGQSFAPSLPDWQLVPIARFADSPYTSLVTLFGELEGGGQRPPKTQYVVALHPDLEGTLLGLRIFQGDFLLLDPNVSGELPTYDGRYLLGTGERTPDRSSWFPASVSLNRLVAQEKHFDSYVICDAGPSSTPRFGIKGERLRLYGALYFYFWKRGGERVERVSAEPGRTIVYHGFEVVPIHDLSRSVSSQTRALRQANPAVYQATLNTMLYAGFFRYAKQRDPNAWREFLRSLDHVPRRNYCAPSPVVVQNTRLSG